VRAGNPSEAVKSIFIAMIEGDRKQAIAGGRSDPDRWEKGIRDLYRTTEHDGMFCYTFFKLSAEKMTQPRNNQKISHLLEFVMQAADLPVSQIYEKDITFPARSPAIPWCLFPC
jgi:hypothetical protein